MSFLFISRCWWCISCFSEESRWIQGLQAELFLGFWEHEGNIRFPTAQQPTDQSSSILSTSVRKLEIINISTEHSVSFPIHFFLGFFSVDLFLTSWTFRGFQGWNLISDYFMMPRWPFDNSKPVWVFDLQISGEVLRSPRSWKVLIATLGPGRPGLALLMWPWDLSTNLWRICRAFLCRISPGG